ncbi:MAG: AAA family ATPase [Bacteroidetes bacterium]|nr:AAA family ATPase [Bacteroidota bacterium]
MKLLSARFQNFRMLRDLELEFSHDSKKKLTVIRAANESGKTTILYGLQWALYGDVALPGKGVGFRLHPIDWEAREGKSVSITAEVEFELTKFRPISGIRHKTSHRYRLIRSTIEGVDSNSRRPASTVKLFQLTDTGASPIRAPESLINDELPRELREVFFTDGDRALSFIEADVTLSTKRGRVQRAIHSLLGLEVISAAIKHVRKSEAEVNKKAKQLGGTSELNAIATRLEAIENNREALEAGLEDEKQGFKVSDEKCDEIDREISAVLVKGDKEKLKKDLNRVREKIKQLDQQHETAKKDHSTLFRGRSIATDLVTPVLASAFEKLDELHDQGKIPNTTIPVLHDRLEAEVCICGETLKPGEFGAEKRRAHIQKLIENNLRTDEIQKIITALYYSAKEQRAEVVPGMSAWLGEYEKVLKRRDYLKEQREEKGRELRGLEAKLDSLPDTNIQGLRETLRNYKKQRDRHLSQEAVIKTKLEALRNEHKIQEEKRDRLLYQQKRGALILAELDVTRDTVKVLRGAYERIANEELQKVSNLMNNIFLEMIGADPEQGAIIRHAEISREFDIIVYGPDDRTLNPDRDLNGASRRALTLAFILALTKVSEVEAPNVIDTPLGMTSGFVKQSILRTAVRESEQLILFLTHDEINGCEEIIDEAAGVILTLTNPAHYPRMLINDPEVVERKVLRCSCDHRNTCKLCQRRLNSEVELDTLS